MRKETATIHSSILNKDVNIAVYGHFGVSLLMFTAYEDDCLEYEKNGLIDAIAPFIKNGKCKVYIIPSLSQDNWLNDSISPKEKSQKHLDYNNFVIEEAVAAIYNDCGSAVPIITCGAATGAYHAANTYFRRPDLFLGTIAIDGFFDIGFLAKEYFDDNCYFNSPMHYLPNLNDNYWLTFLKSRHHVYLFSSSGEGSHPDEARKLDSILSSKGIPHKVDIWGKEWNKDWTTWKTMLPEIISKKL